ncbi:mitochondrial enolase superfamily member 1 [Grus japonensis]|uniref:Mitochondrial enolase superfamily member 1 n=1 Tax=Grus japonensis TaxID=30415 RepID=A0ABC9Y797_GRUJA
MLDFGCLSDGGEEMKVRDAGTKGRTGKELLREAEGPGRAERSPMSRVAGRFSGWYVHVYAPEGCATIQGALNRSEKAANWNLVKFDKGACKVLHLGRNSPRHPYTQGASQLESSWAGKRLGVLVDIKLTMIQQSALVANGQQPPGPR